MHIRGSPAPYKRRQAMKRAIIIYESVYGNTKQVAEAIADGMRAAGDIETRVLKTGEVHHTDDVADFDAVLFGCPNHNQEPARNMVKFLERVAIVEMSCKIGSVFDTYTGGNKGVAMKKLGKMIRKKIPGIAELTDGFSALVEDRKGPLSEGELEKAQEFGKAFGSKILE
ncbi:MAG: flavodoxin family protein [Candidatus Hodarchaeota archaeon]